MTRWTFCNQTWYCGAPPRVRMSCEKMGSCLQDQGHSVSLYDQNKTVSTIYFISSKPMSLLQPNSTWMQIIISKEVSSENVGLLCSRSMSQPRLKASVNVSLDDILRIAEPFVTKPNMVRHCYKPERHMRKMGFYLQRQGHSNWILVHTIKYDYFCYMFWTADFWGRACACGVSCKKVALLYSMSRSQWRFWTSVNVCPDNVSDRSNLVWWCIISQRIIQKYHFQGQSHNRFY